MRRTLLAESRRGLCILLVLAPWMLLPAHGGLRIDSPDYAISQAPSDVVAAFSARKRAQMRDMAEAGGETVPPPFEQVLDAVEAGDWETTSDLWTSLRSRTGQYEKGPADPEITTLLWQPLLEVYGFAEQAHLWNPDLLALYADMLLSTIPAGSIYLGGTDPGRFVATAYRDLRRPDFFVVTQNALADATYMDYLRRTADLSLRIPTEQECSESFARYVEDVQAGRISAGAEVTFKDGRATVQGIQGVMAINGMIARLLFDSNKEEHAFLVEESFVIPWMYPYLVPEGPLMKLENEPLAALPAEAVARDRAFWKNLTARLLAHPAFADNEEARKTFSKLRSGIAELYLYRRMHDELEHAFQQAIELYPPSPEANFRLADAYMQQFRFADAGRVIESLVGLDPNPRTREFLGQIRALDAKNARRTDLEALLAKGGTMDAAIELLQIYHDMHLRELFDGLASNLLKQCETLPAALVARAMETCQTSGRNDLAEQFEDCAGNGGSGSDR